jgi:hypothetical protein
MDGGEGLLSTLHSLKQGTACEQVRGYGSEAERRNKEGGDGEGGKPGAAPPLR